jgi:hypothetical protein
MLSIYGLWSRLLCYRIALVFIDFLGLILRVNSDMLLLIVRFDLYS